MSHRGVGLVHWGAGFVVVCSLLLSACGDDGAKGGSSSGGAAGAASGGAASGGTAPGSGGGAAEARFACQGQDGEDLGCFEYFGQSEVVENLRQLSDCVGNGNKEVDACPTTGASICTLTDDDVSSAQFYYDAEHAAEHQSACEARGGTFTQP